MAEILTSIHGNLLGLDKDGNLVNQYGQLFSVNGVQGRGKTIYVDSAIGDDNVAGLSPQDPLATLMEAISRCTASQGDLIVVLPNHAETITGAGGITVDKAGVTILGLGTYNQRPRFLMDGAATVTALITAADVTLANLVFAAGHADIVAGIGVTAAGATLLNLEFVDNVATENFLTPIKATGTTDNEADGLKVVGCRFISPDAAALEFIEVNANLAGLIAQDNFVCTAGTAAPFILSAGTKVLSGALIKENFIQNANTSGDVFIDNGGSTGQSGLVVGNLVGNLDVTGAQTFGAATGLQFFNNQSTSTSTESGALNPAADTPLS